MLVAALFVRGLCLFASGQNDHGKLGVNSTASEHVGFLELAGDFEKIALGSAHALGLNKSSLYGWGSNSERQIGMDAATEASPLPIEVALLQKMNVTDIAAGAAHSLALLGNGSVVAFGSNRNGQLGKRMQLSVNTITLLTEKVVRVAAYGDTSLLLADSGRLYITGECSPYVCTPENLDSGSVKFYEPTPMAGVPALRDITVGQEYLLGLPLVSERSGEIVAWGRNDKGQLCRGASSSGAKDAKGVWYVPSPQIVDLGSPVRKMAASRSLSVFKSDNRALWCGNRSTVAVNLVEHKDLLDVGASEAGILLLSTNKLRAFGLDVAGELGFGKNAPVYNSSTVLQAVRRIVSRDDFTIAYAKDMTTEKHHQKVAVISTLSTAACGVVLSVVLFLLCLWEPKKDDPTNANVSDTPNYVDSQ